MRWIGESGRCRGVRCRGLRSPARAEAGGASWRGRPDGGRSWGRLEPPCRTAQLTKALGALNYRLGRLAITGTRMDQITLTERAAQRIGEILRRQPPAIRLRAKAVGGGCSGFQYKGDMDRPQAAEALASRRD